MWCLIFQLIYNTCYIFKCCCCDLDFHIYLGACLIFLVLHYHALFILASSNNFFPVLGVQQQPQIQTVTLEQQQIQTATMQQPPPEPPPVPSSPAERQLQGIKKESDAASPSKTQKSPGPKRVDTKTDANRSSERLVMQANTVSTSPRKEELIAEPEERIMDDAVRRTRAKLRKRPPIGGPSATHWDCCPLLAFLILPLQSALVSADLLMIDVKCKYSSDLLVNKALSYTCRLNINNQ